MGASAAPLQLGSIPIPRTRLIGRAAETFTARALLLDEAVPLLTLTGPGGLGKTRLTLAIAQDVASSFADGVVWGRSDPMADPSSPPFHQLPAARDSSASAVYTLMRAATAPR